MNHPRPSMLRRSLRACTLDASLHAAMIGFGETYFAAFALLLGASPFQVGVLATLPILAGAAFQLLSTAAAHRVGDRSWVIASAALQAATFVPIVLLVGGGTNTYALLLFWVCVYWMLNLGINPAWNAWMGRMIPPEIRSRYFGRRNVWVHAMIFLSLLAGGLLIDAGARTSAGAATGFAVTFGLAAISRAASVWFLRRQHDPGAERQAPRIPTRVWIGRFSKERYGQLIVLLVLMNGCVHISAAYFTPFMLEELQLSYARFTILNGIILVARVLASTYWGEIARSYGNRRALQVSAVLLVPLASLWVVSDNYAYLIGLQLFAGFAWAGFELSMFLNLFDCTDDRNRAQVLSIYNVCNSVAIVVGSLLGGIVLRWLGDPGYFTIFVLSSLGRAVVVATMARGVGVRRRTAEHSFRNVFLRVITLRTEPGPDLRPIVMDEERKRKTGVPAG
jgi:MFS family permease